MAHFVIDGGRRLSGRIRPGGNKNEALPLLAAVLLTEEAVTLRNLPRIADVDVMLELLASLGVEIHVIEPGMVRLQARHVGGPHLDRDLCHRIRSSVLFAGPVLARLGEVFLPPPGGDVLGRRRLDTHFVALEALGATHSFDGVFHIRAPAGGLHGASIFLDEKSVTGTENAVMAAVLAKGSTTIENAACEPHVQGLCRLLVNMGARIDGIGTHVLHIHGVTRLSGAEHEIGPDYLEIGSFIGLSAVCGGPIVLEGVRASDLRMIRIVFSKLGIDFDIDHEDTVVVQANQDLEIRPDLLGSIPVVSDAPWPQFPTDLMSIAIVVATRCRGTCIFFEKMFDGRMFFVDYLQQMGAQVILCDPHRVVVVGPSKLYGTRLDSPDVRAGMAMLIAALMAEGRSEIHNIGQIDRGYEGIDVKLRSLGAHLERVEG